MHVDRERLALIILVVWSLAATLYSVALSFKVAKLMSSLEEVAQRIKEVSRRAEELEKEAERLNDTLNEFKRATIHVNVLIDYGDHVERHMSLLVPKNSSALTALRYVADAKLDFDGGKLRIVEVNGVEGCWRVYLEKPGGEVIEVDDPSAASLPNNSTVIFRHVEGV